jgi:arylsulfatase A-like enzyme
MSNSRFSRRSFLAGTAGFAACSQAPRKQPPNIVFLFADDMGYGDLSSYGCPDIRTPHTDSIGASGVRFTHCYANAPECTPTRTALMTGRYQQRVGGLECAIGVGNVGRYDEAVWLRERDELGLPATDPTMPRYFKRHGYDTALFGKWHLGYSPQFSPNRHGFDEFFGVIGGNANYFTHREAGGWPVLYHNERQVEEEGYLTDMFVDRAVDWLGQRRDDPFLLYLPFTTPHTPLQGPSDGDKVVTDDNFNQGERSTYVKMVENMDDGVGRVLAKLDEMGVADNTLVVFKSDNGGYGLSNNGPFQSGKGRLWEGGIRVPCMMRWPGALPAGTTTSQVSLTMDLLPTFLAAIGANIPPERFDGVNLLPILTGEQEEFVRTVFFRYKRLENRRKAVLHGSMKYLLNNGDEYLYNLAEDPGEVQNLLADFPGVATELKDKLAAWEVEVRAQRLETYRRL